MKKRRKEEAKKRGKKKEKEKTFLLFSIFFLHFFTFTVFLLPDFHFLISVHFLFTLRRASTPNPAKSIDRTPNPGIDSFFSLGSTFTGRALYSS